MMSKKAAYDGEELFHTWIKEAHQSFSGSQSFSDVDIPNQTINMILRSSYLFGGLMTALGEVAKTAFQGNVDNKTLDDFHEKISQQYTDFYNQNIGRYLTAPQLGLAREALEKILTAVDKYNRFIKSIGDFCLAFNIPFKDSLKAFQGKIKERNEEDGLGNSDELYSLLLNILDKKYDKFLKSPKGVRGVANVVKDYLEYTRSLEDVKEIWFRSLSLPSKREMEDIFKRIYHLRKKSREQDSMIQGQKEVIEGLNSRIKELEAYLPESRKKGRPGPTTKKRNKKKQSK